MSRAIRFAILAVFLLLQAACASRFKHDSIYDSTGQRAVALHEVTARLKPGSVAIVSEQHGYEPHHENQKRFLESAAQTSKHVSVGLEFLAWPHQSTVDRYLAGNLTEAEFLKAVEWGRNSFADYRFQTLFPAGHGGKTLALNAPRKLTSQVAKSGLSGLTKEERALLPPGFELGNAEYRERFAETMKDHANVESISRFFEAQSVWDDTMAWVSAEYLKKNPEQALVIIVGDFHVAYGGGLPARLKARGVQDVISISQVKLTEDEDPDELVEPSERWGPRADFIWVSED